MNGLTITTTDTGLILHIPWKAWLTRLGLFRRRELTEEDVLKIVEEGRQEHLEGKTESFRAFIKREYPEYAHYFDQKV